MIYEDEGDDTIIIEVTTPQTTIVEVGLQGPQGPQGTSGVDPNLAMMKAVYDTNNLSTDIFNFATAMAVAMGQ